MTNIHSQNKQIAVLLIRAAVLNKDRRSGKKS